MKFRFIFLATALFCLSCASKDKSLENPRSLYRIEPTQAQKSLKNNSPVFSPYLAFIVATDNKSYPIGSYVEFFPETADENHKLRLGLAKVSDRHENWARLEILAKIELPEAVSVASVNDIAQKSVTKKLTFVDDNQKIPVGSWDNVSGRECYLAFSDNARPLALQFDAYFCLDNVETQSSDIRYKLKARNASNALLVDSTTQSTHKNCTLRIKGKERENVKAEIEKLASSHIVDAEELAKIRKAIAPEPSSSVLIDADVPQRHPSAELFPVPVSSLKKADEIAIFALGEHALCENRIGSAAFWFSLATQKLNHPIFYALLAETLIELMRPDQSFELFVRLMQETQTSAHQSIAADILSQLNLRDLFLEIVESIDLSSINQNQAEILLNAASRVALNDSDREVKAFKRLADFLSKILPKDKYWTDCVLNNRCDCKKTYASPSLCEIVVNAREYSESRALSVLRDKKSTEAEVNTILLQMIAQSSNAERADILMDQLAIGYASHGRKEKMLRVLMQTDARRKKIGKIPYNGSLSALYLNLLYDLDFRTALAWHLKVEARRIPSDNQQGREKAEALAKAACQLYRSVGSPEDCAKGMHKSVK